jgi:glycosyltransferase involved in cell wall biosynthesis/GT2 family glycosyltransferase
MDRYTEKDFTVVICSAGRPQFLLQTLKQFLFLEKLPTEVILVLGPGNEDLTFGEYSFNLKVKRILERNLSLARNIGLSLAKTHWVIYLDDDAYPSATWIQDYIKGANSNPERKFFSGKVLDPKNMSMQYKGQITNLLGVSEYQEFAGDLSRLSSDLFIRTPLGANFAVDRKVAISIGGFNTKLTWFLDETEFSFRMKLKGHGLLELEDAVVEHWRAPSEIRDSTGHYVSVFQQWHSEGYVAGRYALGVFGSNVTERNLMSKVSVSIANICQARRIKTFDDATTKRLLWEVENGVIGGYRQGVATASDPVEFDTRIELSESDIDFFAGKKLIQKKKVLFIYRNYLDKNEAGIAFWFRTLIEELRNMDYFIEVLCENPRQDSSNFEYSFHDNLQLILAPRKPRLVSSVSNFYPGFVQGFASSVYEYSKKFQCFNPNSYILIPSFEGFGNVIPNLSKVITSLHTTSQTIEDITSDLLEESETRRDFAKLENLAVRSSTLLLANTNATLNYTRDCHNLPIESIQMIYHGITPVLDLPGKISNALNFLYVGRLEPRKGLDLLLDAWEVAISDSDEIKLTVVGLPVGAYGASQIRRIKSGFRGKIDYLGYVDESQKQNLIARSSAVLIPSRYESFGLVALEAARLRRLSIGNRVGGLGEILDQGLGLSLDFSDAESTGKEISSLSRNINLVSSLGEGAFETFTRKFTAQEMAREFVLKFLT